MIAERKTYLIMLFFVSLYAMEEQKKEPKVLVVETDEMYHICMKEIEKKGGEQDSIYHHLYRYKNGGFEFETKVPTVTYTPEVWKLKLLSCYNQRVKQSVNTQSTKKEDTDTLKSKL